MVLLISRETMGDILRSFADAVFAIEKDSFKESQPRLSTSLRSTSQCTCEPGPAFFFFSNSCWTLLYWTIDEEIRRDTGNLGIPWEPTMLHDLPWGKYHHAGKVWGRTDETIGFHVRQAGHLQLNRLCLSDITEWSTIRPPITIRLHKTPTCYRPHKLKMARSCCFPDSCDQCIQVSFAQDVRSPRSSHTSHPRRSTGELRWVALEGSKLWRHGIGTW